MNPNIPTLIMIFKDYPGDICGGKDNTLIITEANGPTTILDVSDIRSPKRLGSTNEYFHYVDFQNNYYYAVMNNLKIFKLIE